MIPRLDDIVEAIERVREVVGDRSFEAFEADWQSRWLVERGVEIMSEASRHLTAEFKARHPDIPWRKVSGIGNVLRHNYENVAAPVMWSLVHDELPRLERVCRQELAAAQARNEQAPD
jgi:uncharacterized protein with HEPN domain